jgi:non-specific serine/threonine protein kinase
MLAIEQAVDETIAELSRPHASADSQLQRREPADQHLGGLTDREREVAIHIAQGQSNRAIAADLVVGIKTVEAHISRILTKLGFTSRAQIAGWAVGQGLAPAPQDLDSQIQD